MRLHELAPPTPACEPSSPDGDAKSAFSLPCLESSKLPVPLNRFQVGRLYLVDSSPAKVLGQSIRVQQRALTVRLGNWPHGAAAGPFAWRMLPTRRAHTECIPPMMDQSRSEVLAESQDEGRPALEERERCLTRGFSADRGSQGGSQDEESTSVLLNQGGDDRFLARYMDGRRPGAGRIQRPVCRTGRICLQSGMVEE